MLLDLSRLPRDSKWLLKDLSKMKATVTIIKRPIIISIARERLDYFSFIALVNFFATP